MKIKYLAICLFLLCCLIGAVSAADDVSTDTVDVSVEDIGTVDFISEDKSISQIKEKNSVDMISDDFVLTEAISEDACDSLKNDDNSVDIIAEEINTNNTPILGGVGGGQGSHGDTEHFTEIYRNKTYNGFIEMQNDCIFFDCNFTNSTLDMQEFFYHYWLGAPENLADIEESFVCNFTNCNFINSTIDEGSLVYAKRYSLVNFINCTFENITANSIVTNVGGFTLQDAINFYGCSFNNVNVKGIVDVPTRANPFERYRIEDCTYDGLISDNYDILTENNRDYVNATKSRLSTVLIADIDDEGNLVVSLNDVDGNPLANYDVFISINGDEATPYGLDDNGKISIDLTEYKGELNITVAFEEDDDYKGSSDSINTFLVIKTVIQNVTVEVPVYVPVNQTATTIVSSDLAATAKIAKTLSLALKDANGKALANRIIQVVVNGKISTIATDENGNAKINISYANAGTYYYTLSFLGDNDYKASIKAVKVTVNKQVTKAVFAKKTFKVKAAKKLSFTLKDSKGKAIKGKKITFTVNKKTYTAKTNAKGIATVKVKLTKKGKYTAVAKFAGDSTYKAISKKAKITIK